MCLFGKCHYCVESEVVCADNNTLIEGAVLQIIPGKLKRTKSPWARTYKDSVQAEWETNMHYCEYELTTHNLKFGSSYFFNVHRKVKEHAKPSLLLDMIDAAIFDFIIQNGDRHHYDTINDRIVLLDNGKGFGNHMVDFIDILAPLYQCCT